MAQSRCEKPALRPRISSRPQPQWQRNGERPPRRTLDVLQDEATKAESKSGLPMFGDHFTAW